MNDQIDSFARAVVRGTRRTNPNMNRRMVLMTLRRFVLHVTIILVVLRAADAGQINIDLPAATPSHDQAELPTAQPEDVGMSSEKLALVKPALQKFVDNKKVPGAIVIAARRGNVVLFESVGWRDIKEKSSMQKDSILRFYSMTKPITSVSIMMLVEEGKIRLDDPVSKHVPEFDRLRVFVKRNGAELELEDAKREMKIRDLLRHTSGLTYGFFGVTAVDLKYRAAKMFAKDDTLQDTITKLAKLPLLYQPGTRFNYSVSTDVLGHIVERVSGQRLDQFFQERILGPLDMHDTAFFVAKDKAGRFSNTYGPKIFLVDCA